jgi:hypothetical protein
VVSSKGQLGIVLSSARYKRDIRDMDDASSDLMKLRPVTFRYKDDAAGTLQYGLVAEEVEKLYPELVTHAADGQVESVRYSMLTGMLLNELQKQNTELRKQHAELREQTTVNERQADQNRKLATQVEELKVNQEHQRVAFEQRFTTLERALTAKASDGQLAAAFNK